MFKLVKIKRSGIMIGESMMALVIVALATVLFAISIGGLKNHQQKQLQYLQACRLAKEVSDAEINAKHSVTLTRRPFSALADERQVIVMKNQNPVLLIERR